jgi:amphi-Trp domain-containing protein
MSKNGIALKGHLDRKDLTCLLDDVVQGFKDGTVCIRKGNEFLTLKPTEPLEFEIEAEVKKGKEKLVLELMWGNETDSVHSDEHGFICPVGPGKAANAASTKTPPPAGTTLSPSDERKAIAHAWSIKDDILGKVVHNDANEKVGTVEDLIVTHEKGMSYAIVGAGGFLGLAKHDVAIPVHQFVIKDKHIVLPGATKEAVKAMPAYKHAVT